VFAAGYVAETRSNLSVVAGVGTARVDVATAACLWLQCLQRILQDYFAGSSILQD
jgi:hypothetical protein